jgi:hypothetical protein|nr:MAG TPA: hypothetical protein [Caudoviricetes sp.]
MIDCTKTENYLAEKQRMTKKHKPNAGEYICELDCLDCPLSHSNNGIGEPCFGLETLYPEKVIAIVQKWSNEHPQKTYLSEFLKNYPNAPLVHDGTPEICLRKLGLTDIKTCRVGGCVECWNQPIEE